MKLPFVLSVAFVACVLSIAIWCCGHRYEFHSANTNGSFYRCDRWTGQVDVATARGWKRLTYPSSAEEFLKP